jgi:site-specific DNA recombinase
VKAGVETRKRIMRLLGMRITVNQIGPGDGRTCDPDWVNITWGHC